MVIDNIFSYNIEKELDKYFEKALIEILSDIKDKNKYKNLYIIFNGKTILSSELYPKIISKFFSFIKKFICKDKEIKENEDLEKYFIDYLKHDLIVYLKTLRIIWPIEYQKIPWI